MASDRVLWFSKPTIPISAGGCSQLRKAKAPTGRWIRTPSTRVLSIAVEDCGSFGKYTKAANEAVASPGPTSSAIGKVNNADHQGLAKLEKIRVKIIARGQHAHPWQAQLPSEGLPSAPCEFVWRADAKNYDWLVVIDDVSRELMTPPETLACADEHTLFVTTEPPTITHYGTAFCAQFAHVLTSQPPEALQHPNRIDSHTGNLWFNGHCFDELEAQPFPRKTKSISTVCSSKKQKHTLHNQRYQFCHWLEQALPELEIYGHGSRYIKNKYDALDPFRFHLAIENYIGRHHWTEKLADAFLSGAFPIYCGCPNIADYFPEDSFLLIDLSNPRKALDQIRERLANDRFDQTRIDAMYEARRRVLHEYNLLNMITTIVAREFDPALKPSGRLLYNRKQMRLKHPGDLGAHLKWSLNKVKS